MNGTLCGLVGGEGGSGLGFYGRAREKKRVGTHKGHVREGLTGFC